VLLLKKLIIPRKSEGCQEINKVKDQRNPKCKRSQYLRSRSENAEKEVNKNSYS
jgi:hypothetical protein